MFGNRRKRRAFPRNRKAGSVFGLMVLLMVLFCLTSQVVYAYDTPTGYDNHDYQKLVAFLELPNGTVKNGDKISEN